MLDYLRAFATTDAAGIAWSIGALLFAITGTAAVIIDRGHGVRNTVAAFTVANIIMFTVASLAWLLNDVFGVPRGAAVWAVLAACAGFVALAAAAVLCATAARLIPMRCASDRVTAALAWTSMLTGFGVTTAMLLTFV